MIKNVFFRIEVGYVWGKGYSKEQNIAFEKEVQAIFSALGWGRWKKVLQCSSWTCYFGNTDENLYCHPMSISGEIDIERIPAIEEALKNAKGIQFRGTDTYNIEKKQESIVQIHDEIPRTAKK